MNILHIDSSILGELSVSCRLSAQLVERLVRSDPNATVIHRDLASDPIPHLGGGDLGLRGKITDPVLAQFKAADIVVIGSPMYNFSISSHLKAWIDRIAVAGETFGYTASGPVGLATGKRVYVVTGRGSAFAAGPMAALDHQEPYLRSLFGFLGIDQVTFIHAQGLAMGPDAREPAIARAEAEIAALELAA